MGKTWAAIAKDEGCHRATFYRYLEEHGDIAAELDQKGDNRALEKLKQTAFEVAIKNGNTALLIFLLKARFGYSDHPQPKSPEPPKDQVFTRAVTKEEALKMLEKRKEKNKDVPPTG